MSPTPTTATHRGSGSAVVTPTRLPRTGGRPGYGEEKVKILLAVLGKRFGVCPPGWEAASAPFSDDQPRSVADMGSAEERLAVRAWKKAQKAAGKPSTSEPSTNKLSDGCPS